MYNKHDGVFGENVRFQVSVLYDQVQLLKELKTKPKSKEKQNKIITSKE